MRKQARLAIGMVALTVFMFVAAIPREAKSQQKDMPEVTMLTAVPNFAFAAIWVAEQLKYFEQEGVRMKITPAPSGSVHVRGTRPGEGRGRAGDRDSSAQPYHDVGRGLTQGDCR
jgi:ABC-type nitrate/sulfonate/bicarbonate transport system substrate-binding protein